MTIGFLLTALIFRGVAFGFRFKAKGVARRHGFTLVKASLRPPATCHTMKTMRNHPTPEIREQIRAALAAFPELELVIVFGSFAKGTERADSDIDVAVQAPRQLTADQRIALMETLALRFNRPVDLIDLRTVGEPLLGQIVSEGIRVHETPGEWGRLLFRNIMDNEDFLPLQERILRERREAWLNN
ncbi:MAG: nucleotidyltransferase domain-containing protein [Gammaproteobacteria bacterium]|nr:nucleotidyltransferase domain-containing protein [Gammaproteobacteria bacterium]